VRRTLGLAAGLVSVVALVIAIAAGAGDQGWFVAYDDALGVVLAVLAGAAALAASRCTASSERQGWVLLSASVTSWGLGGVAWMWVEVVQHQNPFPSVADVGYVAALAFGALSMWRFAGPAQNWYRLRAALDGLAVAMCLVVVAWQIGLEQVWQQSHESGLARVLSLIYPVGDLVIVALAVHMLTKARPAVRPALRRVAIGISLFGLSDGLFSYLTTAELYNSVRYVDAGWLLGCVAIAAGAAKAAAAPADTGSIERPERTHWTALRFVGPALTVVVTAPEFVIRGRIDTPVFFASIAMIVALAARQALAIRDNSTLAGRLDSTLTLLQTVLSSAPFGFAYVDCDGRVVLFNPFLADLVGGRAEDQVGRKIADITPTRWPEIEAATRTVIETGLPVSNVPMVSPHRNNRSFLASYYPVKVGDDVAGVGFALVDVTEHERAEQAEREARSTEARFDALVRSSNDLIAIIDPQARLVYANPASEAVLGYTPAEQAGRVMFDLIHPDDVAKVIDHFTATTSKPGRNDPVEFRMAHKDGGYRYLEAISNNLLDDPDVGGVVVNARDVTERHEAEARLRDRESWLQAIVGNASDVVVALSPDGSVNYVSPSIEPILGYTRAEFLGRSIFDLLPPGEVDRAVTALARATTIDRGEPLEIRARHADGSWRWIEAVSTNLLDDPIVNAIVLHGRDVTDRHEASDRLRASERQFRLLAENASDLIFRMRLAPDVGFDYVSPAATRITGHSPEEFYADPGLGRRVVGDEFAATFDVEHLDTVLDRAHEVPMRHEDGHVVWVEMNLTPVYADGSLVAMEGIARDVTDRKDAEARLAYQALHDPLTGLPNRSLLLDRLTVALARSERSRSIVGVLYVDLDHFKRVNDAFGHSVGDDLLQLTAEKLQRIVRPSDTVARLGGDEFVVVAERRREADVDALAERITTAISGVRIESAANIVITASVGLAVGRHGDTADSLVSAADVAMYRAKQQGRDRALRFDAQLREEVEDKVVLEGDLRSGIERDELRLFVQPVVDLISNQVVGGEALVRWQHPTRGLLLPAAFITLAEETGLIGCLGSWVLREACRSVQRLRGVPGHEATTLSVNVSVHQLRRDGCDEIARVLEEEHVDPSAITLEITESALMEDVTFFAEVLDRLKALGVNLSVDDFGTGYSSLGYLREFPVDVLKIDRSFVDGLGHQDQDEAVVAAIMSLARTLNLSVVAEGVEEPKQAERLRRLGCPFAQGYLFAKPMPADEFHRHLKDDTGLWNVA
jgi:diguanylate cyclase (GGDEF)-like protein/PAS domain S-box-containing protein